MAEVVLCAASTVAGCLVAPVNRLCGYVISYDSHVCELEDKVAELGKARQEVQDSINDAQNNGKPIKAYVNEWVKDVENHAEEARRVLDDKAKITCFRGWLPNLKVRYRLGREARRKAERIQGLINRTLSGKVYDDPPPGLIDGGPNMISPAGDRGDTIFESRASILEDIMNALDDEKLKVIGIYGEGGVGKTTLLKQVEEKLRNEKRLFRLIAKANVSQNQDLKKIQDDIAYALGLKNLKDQPSEEGRKDLLFKRLQKDPGEKILIILDDLWKELDLREVGIPSGDESKGCKLLLTSRFKNVLEQMKCDTPIFHLEGLKDDEAFRLFEKTVGDRLKDDELKAIATKVVKKLAGLPLLITSIARNLKGGGVHAWNNALIKIDVSKVETIVKLSYDHLESEDTKSLFLLCGLIGGTIPAETLFILGMGLGLFKEFNKTIQGSRDRLNTMLDELHSACLLLGGGDGKDYVTIHDLYSEVVVSTPFRGHNSLMMNSNYGLWPKEKLEKCWAICLDDVGRDKLIELMACQFPDLKILMLSQLANSHDVGDCSGLLDFMSTKELGLLDFMSTKELQVLYICSMRIAALPSSIRILGNLQSLYLDHCHLKDVAILGNLKALQILSFAGSTISRLPQEIGGLTNLRLLNLSNCNNLKIIEPNVLKCLTNLEELLMGRSFNQWMDEDKILSKSCNARLVELKSLKKLTALEISILNPTILLEDDALPLGNLLRFWIDIGNANKGSFGFWSTMNSKFKRLRTMKPKLRGLSTMNLRLVGCNGILSKEWVQKALQKTQYLYLYGLTEFKFKNAHELCIQGFPQLKFLHIKNSPSIKYIASSSNSAFTILESLFLSNLMNLEKICHDHITTEGFSKLKYVTVEECFRLNYLWCLSQMKNPVQLEEISVWKCHSMRAIVTIDARKDIVPADYRAELPYVRHLDLARLPNMKSFCIGAEITLEGAPIQAGVIDEGGGDEGTESVTTTSDLQDIYSDSFFDRKVSLPNLENLELDSVGSFKRIWHDELSRSSICQLVTITVENCSDLLHIFPLIIIGRLYNLRRVKVKNCPSLKSLFDFGSLDSNMEQNAVLLPELVSIEVESCPSLKSLFNCESLDSNAEHKLVLLPKLEKVSVSGAKKLRHMVMSHSQMVLNFPSLRTVSVKNCSDLRYLFSKCTATSLKELKRLEITKCGQMKEVILEKEAGRSEAEVMSFPCLSELTLKELKSFGAFILSPMSVKRQLGETAKENDESAQPLFNEMVTFPNITSLEIKGLRCKELWNIQIPTDSFHKLEYLELRNCDNLQRIATSYMWKKLQRCLEKLQVISCRSIEIIYEGDGIDTDSCKLRRLVLRDLKNLRCIWQFDSLPFPNLRDIEGVRCPRLEMLFPTFTVKFLGQIEELVVESCEDMELIAGHEKWEEATGTTTTFSKLTVLRLFKLPKFRRFFLPEKYSLKFSCLEDFPSLRILSIKSCGAEPDQVLGDCVSTNLDICHFGIHRT